MPEHDSGTDRAAQQWREYVDEIRRGDPPPFDEQWARYREIFADRAPELGPPPAWQPTSKIVARSNINWLMEQEGFASYAELHRWSVEDRAGFWQAAVERLGIRFSTPPVATLESSGGPTRPQWLPG